VIARKLDHQDTGYWFLDAEKGVARAVEAFAPAVALLLFIKSTEYLVNPVSSILVDH
jgi:hypothetical protein